MKAYAHLIRYAIDNGGNVAVYDGEAWSPRSTDYSRIIEEVKSVDEAELIIRDEMGRRIAWARVSAFGLADDETVIDHTVNDYMDAWQEAYERDTPTKPLTIDQIHTAAQTLRTGTLGGFAAAIGDAATIADSVNLRRLAEAFPDLFAAAIETANDRQQPQTIGDICGAPLTGSNW